MPPTSVNNSLTLDCRCGVAPCRDSHWAPTAQASQPLPVPCSHPSWDELKNHMASLGYASVLQSKALAHGAQFGLATFYRAAKLRLVWQEERSRALLVGLELRRPGAEGAPDKVGCLRRVRQKLRPPALGCSCAAAVRALTRALGSPGGSPRCVPPASVANRC